MVLFIKNKFSNEFTEIRDAGTKSVLVLTCVLPNTNPFDNLSNSAVYTHIHTKIAMTASQRIRSAEYVVL